MRKLKWIAAGLLVLNAVIQGNGLAQPVVPTSDSFTGINLSATLARTGPISLSFMDVYSLPSLTEAQLTTLVDALDASPTVPCVALPRQGLLGNFFSLQHPEWPPLPFNSSQSAVWPMDDFYLMNDLNFDYDAPPTVFLKPGLRTMATADFGPPGIGDGGEEDTNIVTGAGSSLTAADYGTNLWIAQTHLTNGYLAGIGSNTLADVTYEIQSRTNLAQNDWLFEGFILGSALNNWTPLSVAQGSRTNLFLRLRSWGSSGGSGLPDWWQLQYFGTTGVDPYGNPAGDGWSNLQKFQNGWNPTNFYTPAAPAGLTFHFNADGTKTIVSWNAAFGLFTNYLVSVLDWDGSVLTNYNVSPNQTSITLNTPAVVGNPNYPGNFGQDRFQHFRLAAQYAGGNSSAITTGWQFPGGYFYDSSAFYETKIISDQQGLVFLAVPALPPGTVNLRLIREDSLLDLYVTNDIPATNLTNGLAAIPPGWLAPPPGPYFFSTYTWWLQIMNPHGEAAAFALKLGTASGEYSWLVPPFHDGRLQLKQNLIFQLRAAVADRPFQCTVVYTNFEAASLYIASPTNYAYAGFYNSLGFIGAGFDANTDPTCVDAFLPFEENFFDRNFAFNSAALDVNGHSVTGVSGSSHGFTGLTILTGFQFGEKPLEIPLAFQFQLNAAVTNGSVIPALMATNDCRWLIAYPDALDAIGVFLNDFYHPPLYQLDNTARNWFGLPFVSAKIGYFGPSVATIDLTHGNTNGSYFYPETEQPQFQTAEYDFWNPDNGYRNDDGKWIPLEPLPGQIGFSPTNQSRACFFTKPGVTIKVAGYAKLEVQNGYDGVFGYLGQYFDKAYQAPNGITTTNTTGVLSAYGSFFATEPGQIVLVTMPDLDPPYQRGTCSVYSVSLQLDANHDGKMDLSFSGTDITSEASPFVFWANNNYDRLAKDEDDGVNYEDDVKIAATNDCNYADIYGHRLIPTKRDLEDFTRLWLCGVTTNLLATLPLGSSVNLSWGDVSSPDSSNPTIDLFAAADADGGIGYLTNTTIAAQQTNISTAPYLGRLGPGGSLQLNSIMNQLPTKHFIWCGVGYGRGDLTLSIRDAANNLLVETAVSIEIKDIKQMYERWTVGENPQKSPFFLATNAVNDLPSNPPMQVFQYPALQDTNTPYILFVHGWNMETWVKDRFAETAFKRLYWQGYQGRFGEFRWPTDFDFTGSWYWDLPVRHRHFDNSEFQAWKSGAGLKNKLAELNQQYPGNVYLIAHSMGNVVAGEALRLAGNTQLVNTYIAMQGAVASHAYDPARPTRNLGSFESYTPNCYSNYWTNGEACYFNGSASAGTYVNFFNTNDFALSKWQTDQNFKPDVGWGCERVSLFNPFSNRFYRELGGTLNFPTDTYEIFAYCDEARCYALGAQPDVGGAFQKNGTPQQVDLPNVWPADPLNANYTAHLWHSAQFRTDSASSISFWHRILIKFGLKEE